ncbi:MAG: hypothetical protein QOD71_3135 [Thermoleophilaceae bacterium]|nr:hypothetical protein [Thermoleophilaceae bacterium]
MNRPIWRWGGALACVAVGYALVRPGDEPPLVSAALDTAEGVPARAARELNDAGLVARLPFVGTLAWRCDDERRFYTQLTLPRPGATVFVTLDADRKPIWRGKQVNPDPAPRRTVVGPFSAVRGQTWVISYNHEPATLKVVARLRFAAPPSRSQCVVSSTIRTHRTAH